MKQNLRTMVDNVVDGIKAAFDEYTVVGQKKILAFQKTGNGAVVTVESKGVTTQETFADGKRTSEIQGAGMTGGETSEFGATPDNKLLFTRSTGHIQQANGPMDITVEIKYDKVGGTVFPAKILNRTKMVLNGQLQEIPINIYLDNCSAQ
jgi:hypothetical protein